ncbi:MAG: transcription-repair coupling factor [Treponema sp.]|jgi:transcription-repair coupling factor (superfamily II helicase)|nr:transcription-repair coupling factor [Treponema sp.]
MNTLSFPSLLSQVRASPRIQQVVSAFQQGEFPLEIEAVEGSLAAILLSLLSETGALPFLVVVPTETDAAHLAGDLQALHIPALVFPWWGALPYQDLSPHSGVFGERTKVLSLLAAGKDALEPCRMVIASQRAFLSPVPPPETLKRFLIPLKPGDPVDLTALAATLVRYGYTRVPKVQVQGEFALRGEVLDILMGGDETACRILCNFTRIESIKRFDPLTQTSQARLPQLLLRVFTYPSSLDIGSAPYFQVRSTGDRTEGKALMDASREGQAPYPVPEPRKPPRETPRAAPGNITLYVKGGTVCFVDKERLENAQESLERECRSLYAKACREREVPRPEEVLLNFKELFQGIPRRCSFMGMKGGGEPEAHRFSLAGEPPRSFFGNVTYLKEECAALTKEGWKILVAAESEVQASRIRELLKDEAAVSVVFLPLSAGFTLPDSKLMVVHENEIFGRRRRLPRSLKTVRSTVIDTFVELNPGDFVVHVNYGIGLFKGIERIQALGHERDYIKLEYAGEEFVFVPIEQVNLVQRYVGNEGSPPRLDKLGSKSWENRKGRVKQSVEDLARKLITLYSKRKAVQGFSFPEDSEWQPMFEAAFPFEETEDQLRCVEEIKADMESPHPMDRLVCGDVGYGKTEVAVRACFKAIMGGKQVAFLAPTTILAEQHFENFQERFSQFPVRLAMLSRLVERGAVQKALQEIKAGTVDLIVGTHRLIQKDVVFKNLGLLVIDEEQRFGVKDKERLKELKTNVDCLSLSATPIPRTLHMSLLKIRDMSLLATPPQNRHPIETVIEEYCEERLTAAIRREAARGGQVFFLHNRVESLADTRRRIERLLPEMLVDIAHGQMDPQDLEDVMHRFIHGGFHVLVSTTIIENGIDIPNVNTIIIDRADMYGVSQLYQLRGRVGRSDRVAYAYLFYPQNRSLSEVAMKRLQVISDFTDLGSGFKIALKDMEIRGAGNLLGREQSGDIYSVGFDLYLRLLDDAVKRLEDDRYEAETETLLELEYSGFIPDAYIDSPQEKMEVYKKIAAVREKDELEQVYAELLDRFGPLPEEAASLLALAEIRIICRKIGVVSLKERSGMVRIAFGKVSRVNVDRLIRLMRESNGRVKLDPKSPHVLLLATGSIGLKEKSEFIREKLSLL